MTRNIAGLTSALESMLLNEELARKRGPAQSLDPRVKLFTLVLFIVIVGLARSLWVLAVIFILALAMDLSGKIPLRFFLRRVLLFLPFTAIIALPALFITPGDPLVQIGARVIITAQGARTAAIPRIQGHGLPFAGDPPDPDDALEQRFYWPCAGSGCRRCWRTSWA